MPRLSVDISPELKKRLMNYIAKHYDTFWGKIEEVARQAIEEFLDRHEGEEDAGK